MDKERFEKEIKKLYEEIKIDKIDKIKNCVFNAVTTLDIMIIEEEIQKISDVIDFAFTKGFNFGVEYQHSICMDEIFKNYTPNSEFRRAVMEKIRKHKIRIDRGVSWNRT